VRAFPGRGLEADGYFSGTGYYSKTSSYGGREVTLIEIGCRSTLWRRAQRLGERAGIKLAATETRRNIATWGVLLNHLIDREFRVGAVLMRGTRLREPKHLEDLTQRGVMCGLIHRGGLRALILNERVLHLGDSVRLKPS
jgi:hypothetical protein